MRNKTGKEIPCGQCGKLVYLPLWRLRQGKEHFCSLKCELEWVHKRNCNACSIQCLQCGKTFMRPKHEFNVAKFCSKKCVGLWRAEHLNGSDNWRYGKHHTEDAKRRIKSTNIANWQDPDFVKRMVKSWARRPTNPEKQLEDILNKYFPQFKYNGDNRLGVVLGGLIPDFINVNGRKEVIELFGDFYHAPETIGYRWRGSELGKTMAYNSLGFRCLVIWEHELDNESEVVEKIRQFMKVRVKHG